MLTRVFICNKTVIHLVLILVPQVKICWDEVAKEYKMFRTLLKFNNLETQNNDAAMSNVELTLTENLGFR